MQKHHVTNAAPARKVSRLHRAAAIAALPALAVAGGLVGASTAGAADPLGASTAFGPETGATLAGELIVWQGEILANKTAAGFTAFNVGTGAAAASPIATTNPVRTSTVFNGLLTWIDNTANIVRTANPGGTVTALAGALPASSDSLLAVGTQLWISKTGGIDRYSPTASALGGATPLAGPFGATSVLRMASGPDGNIWVIERNPTGVDTVTRWTPAGVSAGAPFNFPSSSADPTGIATGGDNAVWIIQSGLNAIGRLDTSLNLSQFTLPAGAAPQAIVGSTDGVWITENAINSVAKLTSTAGVIARTAVAAPSAFGLKDLIVGPDANVWAVGTVANKVGRFGTVVPTTTTTILATTTTAAATTTAPAPTAAPTTQPPVTVIVTVTAPPVTKVVTRTCIKSVTKKVKVKGKLVSQKVCTKYRLS